MNVEEFICSLPLRLAKPGIFQGCAILEVQDPVTVQHVLIEFDSY